jgi:hypothetical protein
MAGPIAKTNAMTLKRFAPDARHPGRNVCVIIDHIGKEPKIAGECRLPETMAIDLKAIIKGRYHSKKKPASWTDLFLPFTSHCPSGQALSLSRRPA